jgi:hypothetical protein
MTTLTITITTKITTTMNINGRGGERREMHNKF